MLFKKSTEILQKSQAVLESNKTFIQMMYRNVKLTLIPEFTCSLTLKNSPLLCSSRIFYFCTNIWVTSQWEGVYSGLQKEICSHDQLWPQGNILPESRDPSSPSSPPPLLPSSSPPLLLSSSPPPPIELPKGGGVFIHLGYIFGHVLKNDPCLFLLCKSLHCWYIFTCT